VESIEKRKEPDSEKIVLYCYPYAGEVGSEFTVIDGKKCFLYVAENEQTVHEILKNIFLTGTWLLY